MMSGDACDGWLMGENPSVAEEYSSLSCFEAVVKFDSRFLPLVTEMQNILTVCVEYST
jgi:hypothetical protein